MVFLEVLSILQRSYCGTESIASTTRILEMLGCFLNLNKMKTKRLSNV